MMYERKEGQLTWGLIVSSEYVWGEGTQAADGGFDSLNFPTGKRQRV